MAEMCCPYIVHGVVGNHGLQVAVHGLTHLANGIEWCIMMRGTCMVAAENCGACHMQGKAFASVREKVARGTPTAPPFTPPPCLAAPPLTPSFPSGPAGGPGPARQHLHHIHLGQRLPPGILRHVRGRWLGGLCTALLRSYMHTHTSPVIPAPHPTTVHTPYGPHPSVSVPATTWALSAC